MRAEQEVDPRPIQFRYVGIGEGPDDLAPFDPHAFVDALLNGDSPSFEKGVT